MIDFLSNKHACKDCGIEFYGGGTAKYCIDHKIKRYYNHSHKNNIKQNLKKRGIIQLNG